MFAWQTLDHPHFDSSSFLSSVIRVAIRRKKVATLKAFLKENEEMKKAILIAAKEGDLDIIRDYFPQIKSNNNNNFNNNINNDILIPAINEGRIEAAKLIVQF